MGVQAVVNRITARWNGAPPVTIVSTAADLPFPAPPDAEAAYRRGEVHLVDQALAPARAVQVLGHEVVGHHGVRKALGGAWHWFMADLATSSRAEPSLLAARAHIERTYTGPDGACNLTGMQLADEVAASLAEHAMDPATGRIVVRDPLRVQAAALQAHLARSVLLLDVPVCRAQLEGIILLAERYVRYGGRFFGMTGLLARWYAGQMATPKPRPIDNSRPPITLVESESLLRGAKDQADWRERFKAIRDVLVLLAIPVLLVVGVASLFTNPVDFLKSILR